MFPLPIWITYEHQPEPMPFLTVLILLLCAHALCDYPLQGNFLASAKNHLLRRAEQVIPWWHAMAAHCAIHAGAVLLITGSVFLAAAEFVLHFWTDLGKCEGLISDTQDQAIHIGCKVLWAIILVGMLQ